jgi:hypothetical protein
MGCIPQGALDFRVLQDVDRAGAVADVIEILHDRGAETVHWKRRVAFHEQHDRVFFEYFLEIITGGHKMSPSGCIRCCATRFV